MFSNSRLPVQSTFTEMVHAFTAMSTCAFYDSDAGFSVAYIDGKLIHFFHIKGVVTHASIALID